MIRKNGWQFPAVCGCEEFTVQNKVQRESGRTISADMLALTLQG